MTTIAVDAMGADNAPNSEVAGAVAAVRETSVEVVLVGDEARLRPLVAELGAADLARLRLHHASEVVTMKDSPAQAFRQKRDSSLRVAFDLVAEGEADAVVSAGNSGAVLGHGLFVLKRLRGLDRPGIATIFPTPAGTLVLCDMGANVVVKPRMLAQFGVLGAAYDRIVHGHERPRVGLLSNGTEDSKGTDLTRAAHLLLAEAAEGASAEFDYVGYVEGSNLFTGAIDVVATDGFTGNVVLKLSEGVADAVFRMVKRTLEKTTRGRVGGMLVRPAIQELKRSIDFAEIGGAPLIGVRGVVMICHGRSDGHAIKNAIRASSELARAGLTEQLARALERHHGVWDHEAQAMKAASAAAEDGEDDSNGEDDGNGEDAGS